MFSLTWAAPSGFGARGALSSSMHGACAAAPPRRSSCITNGPFARGGPSAAENISPALPRPRCAPIRARYCAYRFRRSQGRFVQLEAHAGPREANGCTAATRGSVASCPSVLRRVARSARSMQLTRCVQERHEPAFQRQVAPTPSESAQLQRWVAPRREGSSSYASPAGLLAPRVRS